MGVEAKKKKKDEKKLKALIYITYLMRFKTIGKKSLDDDEAVAHQLYNAPLSVQERLLAEFTEMEDGEDTKRRLISSKNKDKLISYILVLCLYVADFKFDPTLIIADLHSVRSKYDPNHHKSRHCGANKELISLSRISI